MTLKSKNSRRVKARGQSSDPYGWIFCVCVCFFFSLFNLSALTRGLSWMWNYVACVGSKNEEKLHVSGQGAWRRGLCKPERVGWTSLVTSLSTIPRFDPTVDPKFDSTVDPIFLAGMSTWNKGSLCSKELLFPLPFPWVEPRCIKLHGSSASCWHSSRNVLSWMGIQERGVIRSWRM